MHYQGHQALETKSAFTSGFFLMLTRLVWPLWGINKTAWGAKLIPMADLAFPVTCASLGHLLMAKHCPFCLNVCFSPPTAPHPPPPPTPHPFHLTPPPTPCPFTAHSLYTQSMILQQSKRSTSKTRGIQIACRITVQTSYNLNGTCVCFRVKTQNACACVSPHVATRVSFCSNIIITNLRPLSIIYMLPYPFCRQS